MARTASCHPERKHLARGMCEKCYWAAYHRGDLVGLPRTPRRRESPGPSAPRGASLDVSLPPAVLAAEQAWEAQQRFEREKARRRLRAQREAGRRARPLPRQHPLHSDAALHRELLRCPFISWDTVVKIRELRQRAGWSLTDLARWFGLRPSFVALACAPVDLNVVALPREQYQVIEA